MGLPELGADILDRLRYAADPIGAVFQSVVDTNTLSSSPVVVPRTFSNYLSEYAGTSKADAILLYAALARAPAFRAGGWIITTQSAVAMTLDRVIFVRAPLRIDTYIHELVHVAQYALVGRSRFLVSYFGLSAAEIARRWLAGEPLNPMDASPHESQAYALERRFEAWLRTAHPGEMANLEDVS